MTDIKNKPLIDIDVPPKVTNMETLEEALAAEQEQEIRNTFLDLHEPALMDDWTYRQLQKDAKKYGYAVSNKD